MQAQTRAEEFVERQLELIAAALAESSLDGGRTGRRNGAIGLFPDGVALLRPANFVLQDARLGRQFSAAR